MANVCFKDLREALRDVVGKDDLEALVKEINDKAEYRARQNLEPKAQAFGKTVDELLAQAAKDREIKKMHAYLNILRHKELTTTVDSFKRKGLGLISITGGTVKNTRAGIANGRLSVDALSKAMSARLLASLFKDVKYNAAHKDLWSIFKSGAKEEELAKELHQKGSSSDPKVKAIADSIRNAYGRSRKMLNSVGAYIDESEEKGYLGHMMHDAALMMRPFDSSVKGGAERARALLSGKNAHNHILNLAFERWKNSVLPLLDHDKTFKGANPVEFLRSVWESVTSGVRKTPYVTTEEGDKFRLPSPGNKADRLSKERVLIWKDGASELKYIKQYGSGSLFKTVENTLLSAGRDYGIMRRFGPNPMAMWHRIKKETLEKARLEGKINFNSSLAEKILRGIVQGDRTESRVIGNICANTRAIVSMARLGKLVKWQIQDLGWRLSKMQDIGVSATQTWKDILSDNFSSLGRQERKVAGDITGIWARNSQGSAHRSFAAADTPSHKIAQFAEMYFKYTGVEYMDSMNRSGTAAAIARYLASERNKQFSNLHDGLRKNLRAYGIEEKEWDLLRASAQNGPGRRLFITPDGIWMANKSLLDNYIGKELTEEEAYKVRQEMDSRLSTFFMDQVDDAHPQPNQYEKRLLIGDTARGSFAGDLARTFAMFKLWNISSTRRGLGRLLFGNGEDGLLKSILNGGGAKWMLASFAANMILLTYITEAVGSLMENKTPPAVTPSFAAHLIAESGAGGYYASLLSDNYSFSHTAIEGMGGPMVGTFNDVFNLVSAIKNLDKPGIAAKNLIMNNMPGINTWYLRPALDFMFLNAWYERNYPGYFWKKQQQMLDQTGQQYIINPLIAQR